MTSPLRVLSLFSGIGGLDLGLERAGMQIIAHSETDEYASAVLAKHWPDVPNLGDITKWRGGLDPDRPGLAWFDDRQTEDGYGTWYAPDVIAGGFPCQDISLAGKGAGIDEGTRSGLWTEYARCIRSLEPRYVVIENVAALLGRGLDRVLGDLATLGMDVWWDCIPAAAVGAPHLRDRIFIVATRADVASFDTNTSPMQWASEQWRESYGDTAGAPGDAGSEQYEGRWDAQRGTGTESVCATRTGASADADRERGEWLAAEYGSDGRALAAGNGGGEDGTDATGQRIQRRVTTGQQESPAQPGEGIPRRDHPGTRTGHWAAEPGMGGMVDGISHWLDEPLGVPRTATGVAKRVDMLRCLGNAVVPQVAQYIGEQIVRHHESTSAELPTE